MKKYHFLYNPAIWSLLATNLYIIYYYVQHPNSIHTVVAIYWIQSVLIGLFNFIDIVTLQNIKAGSFKDDNTGKDWSKGCAGIFFLFHYGFFHFVYLIFLTVSVLKLNELDWSFIRISFWLLVSASIIHFVQHKFRNKNQEANLGVLFFLPYTRIVPMHLFILLPNFFNITGSILFLVLKTVADVAMYVIGQKWTYPPAESSN